MSPKLEQALELIREDRPEAVEQALALLQNTVYSFSMKVCGHPQDAEDTMQDVLVKLLPYLPKFDNPQALSVWLYKVASNRCLMNRRGAKNASQQARVARRTDAQPVRVARADRKQRPESRNQRVARRERPAGARGDAESSSAVPHGASAARYGRPQHRQRCTRDGTDTGNRARAAASRTADAPPTVGPHGVRPRASWSI